MDASEILSEVFDRGLNNGVESLSPRDRELYYIQEFIIDLDMGGLSTWFYNRLPDLAQIRFVADAMRKHNLLAMAAVLERAADLFSDYVDPDPPSTWEKVLQQYDPMDGLTECEKQIRELKEYGLVDSTIC